MLRAEEASDNQMLNNRVTDAIARFRVPIFIFTALIFVLGFNGKWRVGLDSANYRGLALGLASGRGYVFGNWASKQAYPGLPYVLAGIEKLLGPANRTPSLAEQQRLLGPSAATTGSVLFVLLCALLALTLTYRLIRLHYPTWVAVTITCGVGTNAVFVQYSNELMTDVPFLLGVVITLYGWDLLARAITSKKRIIALAFILPGAAIAASMRPMFWVLFVCLVGVCAIGLMRKRNKFFAIALIGTIGIGGGLLMLVPRGYEREARDWIHTGIHRLPTHLFDVLHDQLPAGMFGEQLALFSIRGVAYTSILGSVLLMFSTLLLLRRHLLWVLMVWCTFGVTLFLSAEPRYYMMVLPVLMLGWLTMFCEVAKRLPPVWGEIVLIFGLALVTCNNLSRSVRFINEQHHPYTAKIYKNGEYAGVLEMCEQIRTHVPIDKKVLGPSGAIMSVLTGRHVVTQREIIPSGGGDLHTPERMARAKLDYIVLPGKLYRSKEPVIAALITKRVIGAAGPYIAKTSKMALALIKVTAPPGDWRRIPRRFRHVRGAALAAAPSPRSRSSTAPATSAPARRRATDSAARRRAASTNSLSDSVRKSADQE